MGHFLRIGAGDQDKICPTTQTRLSRITLSYEDPG